MKAHIIVNGAVSNTIEVKSLDFMPNLVDASLGGSIGDLYDGENFTKPALTQEEIAQQKDLQFLNEVAQIKSGYTQDEIDSWPEQLREAREWTADNAATTTMLDSIISQTGESKADLVGRILTKANLYAAAFGAALGRKRA